MNLFATILAFVGVTILIVGIYIAVYQSKSCPTAVVREEDGRLRVKYANGTDGQSFRDMNEFEQWWNMQKEFKNGGCVLPILEGKGKGKERGRGQERGGYDTEFEEQTYAKTPINKVDDYEFSRIFGYERNGRMEIPRQNFNLILNKRAFDWAEKPLSSEERQEKAQYMGYTEGFTADGEYVGDAAKEASQQYGENNRHVIDEDVTCHESRKSREVADLVAKAYQNDKDYEPVVRKVAPNQWEVTELKPRRKHDRDDEFYQPNPEDNRVVNTDDPDIRVRFRYRDEADMENKIDPYFPVPREIPWISEKNYEGSGPGPIPNMDRMFGPTFDRKDWIVDDKFKSSHLRPINQADPRASPTDKIINSIIIGVR